jgi:hypothetical protein
MNEMEVFQGWDDERLQTLLDKNSKWQAYNVKEREKHLAGALSAHC